MPVSRWVVVPEDANNKTIVGGPYLWDDQITWTPPVSGVLMLESDALASKYTYPPPEGSGE